MRAVQPKQAIHPNYIYLTTTPHYNANPTQRVINLY